MRRTHSTCGVCVCVVPFILWTEIKVWDVDEKKRAMVLHGHEATVCSVVADEHKIVSGAADKVRERFR